jgi:hypothetical protein
MIMNLLFVVLSFNFIISCDNPELRMKSQRPGQRRPAACEGKYTDQTRHVSVLTPQGPTLYPSNGLDIGASIIVDTPKNVEYVIQT